MGISIPNMKFLRLNLWLGGLYTDNTTDDDNDARQWTKLKILEF